MPNSCCLERGEYVLHFKASYSRRVGSGYGHEFLYQPVQARVVLSGARLGSSQGPMSPVTGQSHWALFLLEDPGAPSLPEEGPN